MEEFAIGRPVLALDWPDRPEAILVVYVPNFAVPTSAGSALENCLGTRIARQRWLRMGRDPLEPQKPPGEEPEKPYPVEHPPEPPPNEDLPPVDPQSPDVPKI